MESNAPPPPGSPPLSHQAGGSVEPLDRARAARDRSQTPESPSGTRYELRDPFAEVTYRTDRLDEIVARAERLGSLRFTAIAADGSRSIVNKTGDRWEHGQKLEQRAPGAPPPTSADPQARVAVIDKPPRTHGIDSGTDHSSMVARVEAALAERYVIKRPALSVGELSLGHTEYRFKGDLSRIAFTETAFRLATDTNSPSVARSMVDVAEARDWHALRVSGTEDFRRMVWLEAASRGAKVVGYEPVPSDLALLKKAIESRQTNRVEPIRPQDPAETPTKATGRGGGRKAVLVAIEALLVAKGVPTARREAVMRAAGEQLAARRRTGQSLAVKVHDASAPAHRTTSQRVPEPTRSQDRLSPGR